MNKNDYIIRLERKEEYREVENVVRESFWNVYRPGCLEHYVSKETLDSMEKVVLLMPVNLESDTTDFRRTLMHPFSCVRNCSQDIWTV